VDADVVEARRRAAVHVDVRRADDDRPDGRVRAAQRPVSVGGHLGQVTETSGSGQVILAGYVKSREAGAGR
jgi:hypothetical protein